jgi:RNA polymerase sigma factor (sigma-70 family)|tara:strand:+ start:351 stop:1427 length:1077 start_codon:yes stop_codon:yes gene_type:complete
VECLPTLVVAARAGDNRAYRQIVMSFQDMAYTTCLSRVGDVQLSQDAAQEAFLGAWTNLHQLREPVAFPAWFRRVVIKHADRQVRKRRPESMSPDEIKGLADHADEPDRSVEVDALTQTVRDAISSLPESLRDVTILYYIEEYCQKEIAAIQGLSPATVKKRLFLAINRLKQRGSAMLKEALKTFKPSANEDFALHVRFSRREGDLSGIKALVLQHPELVSVRTVWGVGSDGHYWPMDATTLFWAVATDDQALFSFLCTQGAEVNDTDKHGYTPLQTLLTKPLEIDGGSLHLNVNAAAGSVVVTITDDRGEPITGYASVPISCDAVDTPVSFDQPLELRLQFQMTRASLYSYWVGDQL